MVGRKPTGGNENPSRRSVLRKVGSTTAGVTFASTFHAAIASSVYASEKKSEYIAELVTQSPEFKKIKRKFVEELALDVDLENRDVRKFETGGKQKFIATFSGSAQDGRVTVEISSLVIDDDVKETKGLIRRQEDGELSFTSIVDSPEGLDSFSVQTSENEEVVAQQATCVPCSGSYCYDVCVTVYDAACNGIDAIDNFCGYPATAACIVLGFSSGATAGAACSIFFAAVCAGDIDCSAGTPEEMCEQSSEACDDPWLN